MNRYDVIVIGSGLGGLSSAAFLATSGKKVLVLERHNLPGGYASSFRRGRFEFEISLHELSGVGHENTRGHIWDDLQKCDVAKRVEFLPIPDVYRSIFPDLDITVPVGQENFEKTLCEEFPHEAEGIKRFSTILFDTQAEVIRSVYEGMDIVNEQPDSFPNLTMRTQSTLEDVLNKEVIDEKARGVIAQLWGYYSLPPSELSFLLFAVATATYIKHGPVHIKGKSQALSQAFVDVIEENGGEIRFNNGAKRILFSEGKISGVVAEDGTEINCPYVMCNVNPLTACFDLIGKEHLRTGI